MEKTHGASLRIDYERISEKDETGTVEIEHVGPKRWVYVCLGVVHGAQCAEGVKEARVLKFGAKLAAEIRRFFGKVRPLIEEETKKP